MAAFQWLPAHCHPGSTRCGPRAGYGRQLAQVACSAGNYSAKQVRNQPSSVAGLFRSGAGPIEGVFTGVVIRLLWCYQSTSWSGCDTLESPRVHGRLSISRVAQRSLGSQAVP